MYKWINLLIVWGVIWNQKKDARTPVLQPTSATAAVRLPGSAQSRRSLRAREGHFAYTLGGCHVRRCKCGNRRHFKKKQSHVFSANFKMSYVASLLGTESTAVHRRTQWF